MIINAHNRRPDVTETNVKWTFSVVHNTRRYIEKLIAVVCNTIYLRVIRDKKKLHQVVWRGGGKMVVWYPGRARANVKWVACKKNLKIQIGGLESP